MDSIVEVVTPEKAAQYLSHCNRRNRPVRPLTVARYAADMDSGIWQLTGEPIIFGSDGILMDGQHRLHAVVKSGIAQRFLVVRGASPETFINLDNGAGRKVSDTTSYTQPEVATGRAMMRGARNSFLAPTNARLNQFVLAHDEAVRWAAGIMHMGGLKPGASVRGAMARAYGNVNQVRLDAFRYVLCTGRDEDGWASPGDSAAHALRDELAGVVRHRGPGYSARRTHLSTMHIYRMTEVAIEKFIENQEVKRLRVPKGFKEMFPIAEDSEYAS
jgi:hypothetical protein